MAVHRFARTLLTVLAVLVAAPAYGVLPPYAFARDKTAKFRKTERVENVSIAVTQLGQSVRTWTGSVDLYSDVDFVISTPNRQKLIFQNANNVAWKFLWLALAASDPTHILSERGLNTELSKVMVDGEEPVVKFGGRLSIQTDLDYRRITRIRAVSPSKTIWTARLSYDGDRLSSVTILKNNATRLRAQLTPRAEPTK